MRSFINLTPLIPLSLERRGGNKERGASAPLRRPVSLTLPQRRGKETLERGKAPLLLTLPPSLIKGRGSGG